jgi:hypothetical protein
MALSNAKVIESNELLYGDCDICCGNVFSKMEMVRPTVKFGTIYKKCCFKTEYITFTYSQLWKAQVS